VLYVIVVPTPVEGRASLQEVVTTASNAISHALLPGLVGGPWHWQPAFGLGAYADPDPNAVLLVSGGALMVMVWSVMRSHRAIFAWMIIGGYELVNTMLLAISRTPLFGPVIGSEYRYSTDAAVVAIVFGCMAFLPLRTDFSGDRPLQLIRRRRPGSARRSPVAYGEAGVAGLACSALIVSGMVSTSRSEPFWHNTAGQQFFLNAEKDIRRAGRSIPIADEDIGARVQGGLLLAYNSPSSMFAGFQPTPTFLKPGNSSAALYVADEKGHIRMATIVGLTNRPGPNKTCGYRVGPSRTVIPLSKRTLPWRWTVRVGYISTGESTSSVTAGFITTPVHIHRGLNALYVMGFGDFDTVTIGPLQDGVSLCTDDVQVGNATPVPKTHP
jgi:hypothetical protein